MSVFDVRELLKMAVKDEETGIAFYRALAESTTKPQVKRACLEIARQEEGHRRRFQQILDSIGEFEPNETYPGEYERYLETLLEERAFPAPDAAAARARSATSDADAIGIAIGLEKDTLLFLEEVKRFVRQKDSAHIQAVIDEERQHLVDLTRLKAKI